MKDFAWTVLAAAALCVGSAQASTVKYETATSFGPQQPTADAYRMTVDAALAQGPTNSALVPAWNLLSNLAVFGNSQFNNNLASRVSVSFAVAATDAGAWSLRFGGDFGYGAAVFLDGVALGFKSTPLNWQQSYADPTQILQFNGVALTAGAHELKLYGLEDCCDGSQQGQFSINGAAYKTFGNTDGLAAVVPEPRFDCTVAGRRGRRDAGAAAAPEGRIARLKTVRVTDG